MNSNQKDSYLFTPPVAPVCGAADGDPKNPSFHKPAWSIQLGESALLDLCPWLYSELHRVDASFVANPTFKVRKNFCLIQARACLLALEQRIAQAVRCLLLFRLMITITSFARVHLFMSAGPLILF